MNEKIKFEKRSIDLEKLLSSKEEDISKLNETIEKSNQEFLKLNSKHNGLLLYASDLQKKLENVEIDLLEKNDQLEKFQSTDWGKLISKRDCKITILQNDLIYYKNELEKMKSALGNESQNYNKNLSMRLDNLIDGYIIENKKYKRMVKF